MSVTRSWHSLYYCLYVYRLTSATLLNTASNQRKKILLLSNSTTDLAPENMGRVIRKHYENMLIQIYWKFYTKKWKFSDKNSDIFSYICSKQIVGTR